mgnify:CR=1 FL=1
MNFAKLQGAGNDFVLLETDDTNRDWSVLARDMCDRHFGIGADGLLLLLPSGSADFAMRMFNPDGSEAEACGNGLRCLVKYYASKADWKDGEKDRVLHIETGEGTRSAMVNRQDGESLDIRVGMGKPEFSADRIPVVLEESSEVLDIKSMLNYTVDIENLKLPLNLVSMGNPHAVYFTDEEVSAFPLHRVGPEVENHRIFPRRTNFEVARPTNRREIEARVWERGAGETLACGTGACAIAVAARKQGLVDDTVKIMLPGGELNVTWNGSSDIFLGGPAEIVFTGHWPDEANQ